MSEFTIDRKSWHYRWFVFNRAIFSRKYWEFFSSRGNFPSAHERRAHYVERFTLLPGDFCQYWRAVLLWPTVRIAFSVVFWALAALVLAIMLPGLFSSSGATILLIIAGAGLGAVVILAAAIGASVSFEFLGTKIDSTLRTGDGLVATAYRSYKGKYCPTVGYSRRDDQ